MPVWAMVITDVVLTAAAIGVFMLFDYVMPQSSGVKVTVMIPLIRMQKQRMEQNSQQITGCIK